MKIIETVKKGALYGITLPERVLRSAVTLTMGVTSLFTEVAIPKLIKESTTYKVTFGMLQQFLIRDIAAMDMEKEDYVLKEQYVTRKMAGSMIEGVGLFAFHFSPVWILAIISDVTGGSKIYLQKLIDDMKEKNIVDKEKAYPSVHALLEGIHDTSKLGVETIDTPPLNMEEYIQFTVAMGDELGKNIEQTKRIGKDLERIWQKMSKTSKSESMSMRQMNGAMTLALMKSSAKKGVDMSKSTVLSSYDVFHEVVLSSYKETIHQITEQGGQAYLKQHMNPFIKQFTEHFNSERLTLTEMLIQSK